MSRDIETAADRIFFQLEQALSDAGKPTASDYETGYAEGLRVALSEVQIIRIIRRKRAARWSLPAFFHRAASRRRA